MSLESAIDQLVREWHSEGVSPAFHRPLKFAIRSHWPDLFDAIEAIVAEAEAPMSEAIGSVVPEEICGTRHGNTPTSCAFLPNHEGKHSWE